MMINGTSSEKSFIIDKLIHKKKKETRTGIIYMQTV